MKFIHMHTCETYLGFIVKCIVINFSADLMESYIMN